MQYLSRSSFSYIFFLFFTHISNPIVNTMYNYVNIAVVDLIEFELFSGIVPEKDCC